MIYVNPVVRASNRDGYVIASFVCDDVSELPAISYLGSDKLLDMGCTAHVIGMGDYEMKSTGVWVLREPTVRVFDAYTKSEVDAKVPKYFDLTANVQTADSGISPFSYYAQPEKTDANIHQILSVTVIDTSFNNPAIAVFHSVTGTTYKFMIYSARTGNVKIRVAYN